MNMKFNHKLISISIIKISGLNSIYLNNNKNKTKIPIKQIETKCTMETF